MPVNFNTRLLSVFPVLSCLDLVGLWSKCVQFCFTNPYVDMLNWMQIEAGKIYAACDHKVQNPNIIDFPQCGITVVL